MNPFVRAPRGRFCNFAYPINLYSSLLISPVQFISTHSLLIDSNSILNAIMQYFPVFLALWQWVYVVHTCENDEDCSLNGICQKATGICICDAGWTTSDCGHLDLFPAKRNNGYNWTEYTSETYSGTAGNSSWGASILQDQNNPKLFHMYTSQFAYGCGLSDWMPNSVIIHAKSQTGPQGPYFYQDDVTGTWYHNPEVVWSPGDDKYLLYNIGRDHTSQTPHCGWVSQDYAISVSYAQDLDGPWSDSSILLDSRTEIGEYLFTNPAPWPLWTETNRSRAIALAIWGNAIFSAPSWNSSYTNIKVQPWNTTAYESPYWTEDPFLWRDKRGNWHILAHWMIDIFENGSGVRGPRVGCHLFSRQLDGEWTFRLQEAFNTTVEFTDGSRETFYRRERPKLFFSDDGEKTPLYLSTGVQQTSQKSSAKSWTLIQPVGNAAIDFETTLKL